MDSWLIIRFFLLQQDEARTRNGRKWRALHCILMNWMIECCLFHWLPFHIWLNRYLLCSLSLSPSLSVHHLPWQVFQTGINSHLEIWGSRTVSWNLKYWRTCARTRNSQVFSNISPYFFTYFFFFSFLFFSFLFFSFLFFSFLFFFFLFKRETIKKKDSRCSYWILNFEHVDEKWRSIQRSSV